ncbi:MAG TPA: tripartite tricarboxylate transporter substrate binding protein [Casimicrobiaceae bacterium]|nr:tripartite tricarboxylate transporter substrate binding protein [Casimicrobiaceae bacterium]
MLNVMLKRIAALLVMTALPLSALAQSYPAKPIRIVVPFGPGSATDTIARMLAEKAGKTLGTTLVVDNRPGANGLIAAREVVSAPKDGYTIIVSSNSAHAANQYLYKNLGYDPVKDFTPITGLTMNPHVLVVRADLPVHNMKELIQYGKDHPGKLNMGNGNTGSLANASLVRAMGGFTGTDIAYKSAPAAVTDLLGGRIDFLSTDYFIVNDHIKVGKLRAIGVTSKTRLRPLPDVAPVAEAIPGYELNGWVAAFAPAGTPPEIVAKLNRAFVEFINSPEFQRYCDQQGMLPFPTTPDELGSFQREQVSKWADVLRKAGVEPE